jgi:hypothetical protein
MPVPSIGSGNGSPDSLWSSGEETSTTKNYGIVTRPCPKGCGGSTVLCQTSECEVRGNKRLRLSGEAIRSARKWYAWKHSRPAWDIDSDEHQP